MTDVAPLDVFYRLIDGIAANRWDELAALYAEDALVRHPFADDASAVLDGYAALHEHFSGMGKIGLRMKAHDVLVHETADPEVVVAEFTYHGRIGEKGAAFVLPAVFVMRVRDGLIVESRDYMGPRRAG